MNNKFIPTRKKRIKYQFVTRKEPEIANTKNNISFYYQICTFPQPNTKRFNMRKFIINGNNEFIGIKNFNLTKKQCKKFFKYKKDHEYKCYTTYTLDDVALPTLSDITLSQSSILSNNYNYTGFAPF